MNLVHTDKPFPVHQRKFMKQDI